MTKLRSVRFSNMNVMVTLARAVFLDWWGRRKKGRRGSRVSECR